MFVAQMCFVGTRAEIMWGWVTVVANVLLFNIEHAPLWSPFICTQLYNCLQPKYWVLTEL